MLSLLFWNLMGAQEVNRAARMASLRLHLSRMAVLHDIDLFVFAESAFSPDVLVAALNEATSRSYLFVPSEGHRLQLLSRLPAGTLVNQYDSVDGRLTIRRLVLPRTDILLAALHLPSKMNWTETDQALQSTVIRDEVIRVEESVGHQRTVLLGDFNMNPFEPGLVGAHGLNAVMTREVASLSERTVSGRRYPFFYNPMWGCFGDRTPGPPGTFYYSTGAPVNFYWSMFDQVLLRPDLMHRLAELIILDSDGQDSLLTDSGHPRKATCSDHLPILVRLDL